MRSGATVNSVATRQANAPLTMPPTASHHAGGVPSGSRRQPHTSGTWTTTNTATAAAMPISNVHSSAGAIGPLSRPTP